MEQNHSVCSRPNIKCKSKFEIEHHRTKVTYEVTLRINNNKHNKHRNKTKMTLGEIFRKLEEYKKSLPIESYALNQTTLEQIFIKMAKE